MKAIVIFHNPRCGRCRRIARTHEAFDWLDRIEVSTEEPRTGALALGEIAVEDLRSGHISKGVEAVRLIARQIPIYFPLRVLSHLPAIARYIDRQTRGCADGSCELPDRP